MLLFDRGEFGGDLVPLYNFGELRGTEEVKSFFFEGLSITSKGEDGLESDIFFLFTTDYLY